MASADSNFDDFCLQCIQFNLNNKIIGIYLHSFTNNKLEIFNTALGGLVRFWDFSFIVIELVQLNPDSSLVECLNL